MNHTRPIVSNALLSWSDAGSDYRLIVNSAPWYDWLETASSFTFLCPAGLLTVRKERVHRGDWFWKAYRKQHGRLRSTYLGKSSQISHERLLQAAQKLAEGSTPQHSSLPILQAKMHSPPVPATLVSRPHLLERLNQTSPQHLSCLIAAAGAGKTTIMCEWCAQLALPFVWVTLDRDDDDRALFWHLVVVALDRVIPGLLATMLGILNQFPINAALTILSNSITEYAQPLVLIMDDYHELTAPAIHASLAFFCHPLPPNLRLIISSRADLPDPLHHVQAQHHAMVIADQDLRFTTDDITAFCTRVLKRSVSVEAIAAIAQQTEGWPMAVHLLAISEEMSTTTTTALLPMSGLPVERIADYLWDTVLSRLPAAVRTFVEQTTLLDHLHADLCEAVTSDPESSQRLANIMHTHLFVTPLDNTSGWYRYHPLFAEAVQRRFRQTQAGRIPLLHQRAAYWYADHHLYTQALSHALKAADFALASALVETLASFHRGDVVSLMHWLEGIPEEYVRQHPPILLLQAKMLFADRHIDAAEMVLASIEQRWETHPPDAVFQGEVLGFSAEIAGLRGHWEQSHRLYQRALAVLPAEAAYHQAEMTTSLGSVCYWQGNIRAAHDAYAKACAISLAAQDIPAMIASHAIHGALYHKQGRLHEAADIFRRCQQWDQGKDPASPLSSLALVGLGGVLYEWNDLDEASTVLQRGVEVGRQRGDVYESLRAYITLAQICVHRHDWPAMSRWLHPVETLVQNPYLPGRIRLLARSVGAQVALLAEDVERAQWWMHQAADELDEASREELPHIVSARWKLAYRHPHEGVPIIAAVVQRAEQAKRWDSVIKALVLQAVIESQQGEARAAALTLARALELAEPHGYLRSFLDEGAPLRTVWTYLRTHMTASSVGMLAPTALRYGRSVFEGAHAKHPQVVLVGALQARELQIVRGLADGASIREIAQDLMIAPSTVKTHLRHIYHKLGVHSRHQAVRAIESRSRS